ncbi:MAG: hypothetical protein VXW32_16360 [Myxococcota bacterium]|nr:hypothetical protein [Myxococcota bacterium]
MRTSRFQAWLGIGMVLLQGCTIETWIDDPDEEVRPTVWITETIFQSPVPQVDVLWVVDNTQSMVGEHAALADAFSGFVAVLSEKSLAYQMGVVTTDMAEDAGVLRGNPWIITPGSSDPQGDFQNAITIEESSTSKEAGIAAMMSALSEPHRSGANRGFRRPEATLHIIVVSDSNDHSDDWLDGNVVQAATEFLRDESEQSGLSVMLSAVVGDVPSGCSGPAGTAFPGARYLDLVNETGGTFESICASDLNEILERFADLSVVFPRRFFLGQDADPTTLRVSVEGQVEEDWNYDSELWAVTLAESPPADARIQFRYQLQSEDEE